MKRKTHIEKLRGIRDPKIQSRIFLVHGRENALRQAVELFLEKQRLPVVVLAETPSEGETIIEKFERQSEKASFAIVLLTPDDCGGLSTEPHEEYRPRARQNVIFELGYFVGRLRRKHVCPIYMAGVEIPSDYHGVVYVPFDESGRWKHALAKELETAGFPIEYKDV